MNSSVPKNFWNSLNGLIGALVILVVVGVIIGIKMIGTVGDSPNGMSTINVDGSGYVVAVPDIATFSFSVTQTAKTVAEAQTKATTQINAALKSLRDQGIEDKDISTQSYTINPHYEYQNAVCPAVSSSVSYCPGGKSVLTGYDVSQTISVKVRDLTKAGTIFTSIGTIGVQNVNGLDFSVDEPKLVQAQAREKAINDAKDKAKVLAKQLGVRIVRVVSFSENSGGGYPRMMSFSKDMMVAQAAAPVAPEIPTGEQKVTSSVTVTYEIK